MQQLKTKFYMYMHLDEGDHIQHKKYIGMMLSGVNGKKLSDKIALSIFLPISL